MQHDHVQTSMLLESLKTKANRLTDALASIQRESSAGNSALATLRQEELGIRRQCGPLNIAFVFCTCTMLPEVQLTATCRMLTLNSRLERVIQETLNQQHSLADAELQEKTIATELASTQAEIGPLQLNVDKLYFLLQGAMELGTGVA